MKNFLFIIFLIFSFECHAQSESETDSLISEAINNDLNNSNNIKDVSRVNALMTAVANDDIEGVKFFTRVGKSSMINEKNIGGATPLIISARNNNLEITKILLLNKADPNISDNEGWTPLMRAAINKNSTIANLLLGKNADISLLNSQKEGFFIHAARSDCSACFNLIINNDYKINHDNSLLKQLEESFVIAQDKQNDEIKNAITKLLNKTDFTKNSFHSSERNKKYVIKGEISEIKNNDSSTKPSNVSVSTETNNNVSVSKKFKFIVEQDAANNEGVAITAGRVLSETTSISSPSSPNNERDNKIYRFKIGTPKVDLPQNTTK